MSVRVTCDSCQRERDGSTQRFSLCAACAPDAAAKMASAQWAEVPRDDVPRYQDARVPVVLLNQPRGTDGKEREAAYVPGWARAFSADLETHPAELAALLALCARSTTARDAFASVALQCDKHEDVPRALTELLVAQGK